MELGIGGVAEIRCALSFCGPRTGINGECSYAVGTMRHLGKNDREDVAIELLSSDAMSTSAIEGEVLDRESVQSSLRRQLGMTAASLRSRPAESGIAEMMADLYRRPLAPITEDRIFEWHRMVMNGRRDITDIGSYRRRKVIDANRLRRRVMDF